MSSIFGKLFETHSNKKYSSQYFQDKWLHKNVFPKKRRGTFLEIGADDGKDKSNTLFFEERKNWRGICVEPSPSRFKLLKENRNCICENYAIAATEGNVEFMDIRGYGKGLSGIVDSYAPEHRERIEKEMKHPENKGYEMVHVPTIPLRQLLKKHHIFHVDFCTIDTEGSELQVVESIDFKSCQFDVILVENNYDDNSVERALEKSGFVLKNKIGIDDVYFNTQFSR
ncbi:FkbM family methyltransferase [bacterium]|nr:FkbM family methyltransferase [bacterium]